MRRAAPGQRTVADVEEGDLGEGAVARGGGRGVCTGLRNTAKRKSALFGGFGVVLGCCLVLFNNKT